MRIIFKTSWPVLAFLLFLTGCPGETDAPAATPSSGETEAATGGEAAPTAGELDDATVHGMQEVLGRLKLVKEEYADAVKDGAVIDAVEYEEAEMFAEQAALHFRRAGESVKARDATAHDTLKAGLGELMKLVANKAPVADVDKLVVELIAAVHSVNPNSVPPAVEGTRDAVARADALIKAEQLVNGYRVGPFFMASRTLYLRQDDGSVAETPAPEGTHYVGVMLREPRTKRSLPGVTVTVRFDEGEPMTLRPVWGEFLHYGANLRVPPDAKSLAIEISPVAYDRHGDMLGTWLKPAAATFALGWIDGTPTAEGEAPTPVAKDYELGDDVLQGLAESRWKGEAGPYLVGFIAEAPEPVWLWKDGKPDLVAVTGEHTHHLEIFLTEKDSQRIVPSAHVMLTLTPKGGEGEAQTLHMHPLLSAFFHYGMTVKVPPGEWDVVAKIMPPPVDGWTADVFHETVEATFEWNSTPGAK